MVFRSTIRLSAIALFCAIILSGCGSLPRANRHGWTLIKSDPPGARIEINNRFVGVTPVRVDIPRIDANLDMAPVVIVAHSPVSGAIQTKYIYAPAPNPFQIFFDFEKESSKTK